MTEEKIERLLNGFKTMKQRKPNAAELREGAPMKTRWRNADGTKKEMLMTEEEYADYAEIMEGRAQPQDLDR